MQSIPYHVGRIAPSPRIEEPQPNPDIVVAALNPCVDVAAAERPDSFNPSASLNENLYRFSSVRMEPGSNGINVARFLQQNFPTEMRVGVCGMVGEDGKEINWPRSRLAFSDALFTSGSHGLPRGSLFLPVGGHTRVHYFLGDAAMMRGAEHLAVSAVQKQGFVDQLFHQARGANLIFLDTAAAGYLDIYDAIQQEAAHRFIKLAADTHDEALQRLLGNIVADPHETRTSRLRALKLNLEEFCKAEAFFTDLPALDVRALEILLAQGRREEFENTMRPRAQAFANRFITSGGAFILSCAAHPLYIFRPDRDTLRVIQPAVKIVSPRGAGDATMAMALRWLARGKPITPNDARQIAAAGLATVQLPGTRLGKRADIEALARHPDMRVDVLPT